ncbi:MAG TPA: secondary thiamine-phosphate synthase enzyme YjbQ [Chlorobaculum sp.]|jgi:secondary thiamine-phosphate synthase enzyme|nr:secondary thiamine-phosphate synthase enzyme YjbQ [Chlorobaculum sp.]
MKFHISTISCPTNLPIDIIDITEQVRSELETTGLREGTVTVLSRHTTACININEKEPRLVQDMTTFLKRLVPRDGDYLHNLEPVDGRDNAHSHLLGLFMNSSETIPFSEGRLLLGEWQSIFLIELDGPRTLRQVIVQIQGE